MLFPGNILSMLKNEVGKNFGEFKFYQHRKPKTQTNILVLYRLGIFSQKAALEFGEKAIEYTYPAFFSQIIFVYLIFLTKSRD
jgi:hypothetical protein